MSPVTPGDIHAIELNGSEGWSVQKDGFFAAAETVDVATKMQNHPHSGWISSLTSGEGLVCRFRGPGRVLLQTRNPNSLGVWVRQFIPLQQQ